MLFGVGRATNGLPHHHRRTRRQAFSPFDLFWPEQHDRSRTQLEAPQFGTFLQDMLPAEKTDPTGDKGKIAASQLDIGKITITNGKIPYRDTRLSPEL